MDKLKELEIVLHNLVVLKDFSIIEKYVKTVLDYNWSFVWVSDEDIPTKLELRIKLTHASYVSITVTEDCERFSIFR